MRLPGSSRSLDGVQGGVRDPLRLAFALRSVCASSIKRSFPFWMRRVREELDVVVVRGAAPLFFNVDLDGR